MDAKRLLGFGFFPEDLPPSYSAIALNLNYDELRSIRVIEKDSACATFTSPRYKNFRRVFGIPNPMHQIKLVEKICENWSDLQRFFSQSKFSTTKPIEDASGKRAIEQEFKFPIFKDKCEMCSFQYRYKLKLDITSFYHSIYTHTIEWALHGRSATRDPSRLGHQLDTLVRNTNKKQSVGIPVGPDTSHVISEIICTALDVFVKNKFPKAVGFRFVDDLNLYFENKSEAEKCLESIESFLNEYHLSCNDSKTVIAETLDPTDASWVANLSSYEIDANAERQRDSIKRYFSLIFDLLSHRHALSAAKFGTKKILRILENGDINPENYDILNSLLFRLCLHAPECLSVVCRFIDENRQYFDTEMLKKLMINILRECALTNKSYEVLWCLWILGRLEVSIEDSKLVSDLSQRSGIELIQLLDMRDRGLLPNTPRIYISRPNTIADENWLVSYTLEKRRWLPQLFTNSHPFFQKLFELDVNFFDLEHDIGASTSWDDYPF